MKRTPYFAAALTLFVAAAAARAQAPAAADPVNTYLRQDTQVALVLDLGQIDLDQLIQYATAKAKEQKVPQADIDKQMAEAKPQIDQAKATIGQFKEAGATRVYALVNVMGAMGGGDFGTVVIPTSSPANAAKVADLIKGMVPQAPDAPFQVTTAGTAALFQSKQAAAQPAAAGGGNPTLLTALKERMAGQAAAISLIVDAKALAPLAGNAQPDDKALIEGTESVSLAANFPPKPTFNAVIRTKDAATAQKLAAKYNESLERGRTDPKAKEVLGDTTALYNAFKPQVQGSTVSLNLDTKVIEEVVAPAFAKAAAEAQKQQQQSQPKPE